MIPLDRAIVARYRQGDKTFEVLVDPDGSQRIRQGESVPADSVVVAREVFSDAKKGLRATVADVNKAFGTNDFEKVFLKIVTDGEIQLTTEQKRRLAEERKKQVVNLIARHAVDPQTGAPHPSARIESAMETARVHIDPMRRAEEQVAIALKAIKPIIPIKLEKVKIAIRIPAQYAPKMYGLLREYKLMKEEWGRDGSMLAMVEMPAGMQGEFYERLNRLTSGSAETKIVGREAE